VSIRCCDLDTAARRCGRTHEPGLPATVHESAGTMWTMRRIGIVSLPRFQSRDSYADLAPRARRGARRAPVPGTCRYPPVFAQIAHRIGKSVRAHPL